MANDVIEVRLPPKSEYLPVLRATIGVIAGGMSFNYDDIIQLRTAISEAFELAIKHLPTVEQVPGVDGLEVRFTIEADRIEIRIPAQTYYVGQIDSEEEKESLALLGSLADEMELGTESGGGHFIRLVKYKSASEA